MQPLVQGQGSSGWTMLSVVATKPLCQSVLADLGGNTTVDIQRMQESFVMVKYIYIYKLHYSFLTCAHSRKILFYFIVLYFYKNIKYPYFIHYLQVSLMLQRNQLRPQLDQRLNHLRVSQSNISISMIKKFHIGSVVLNNLAPYLANHSHHHPGEQ